MSVSRLLQTQISKCNLHEFAYDMQGSVWKITTAIVSVGYMRYANLKRGRQGCNVTKLN